MNRFGSYRYGVTNTIVESWLQQFDAADRDLAARVLDAIDYFGQPQILAAYKNALIGLDGWDKDAGKRKGNWAFAAMSGSAGESGDRMLHDFRLANGLDPKKFNDLFVTRSELFRRPLLGEGNPHRLGEDDSVVLLDDFSGTGKQVCDAWNDTELSFGPLLAGVGKVYLVLVAAARPAIARIKQETPISLVPAHSLKESDDIFSTACSHFNPAEKKRLIHYGKIANRKHPRGYGECGLVVVFQHRTPNSSLPILHARHDSWDGLFPRHADG
jgi:hypothetical protein